MLNNITDGTVSVTGTKYGSLATYTCSTGHYISAGHENRTCGNGTWGGVEPTCTIYGKHINISFCTIFDPNYSSCGLLDLSYAL